MKINILVLSVFLLTGCATEKGYQEYLNTWLGDSQLALIRDWGIPEKSYEIEGHQFYEYKIEVHSNNPNYPYTCPELREIKKGDSDFIKDAVRKENEEKIRACIKDRQTKPRELYYHCTTTFEIFDAKVVGYKFKGNDCVK